MCVFTENVKINLPSCIITDVISFVHRILTNSIPTANQIGTILHYLEIKLTK